MLVRLAAVWTRSMEGGGRSFARPLARHSLWAGALLLVFSGRHWLVYLGCASGPGVYYLGGVELAEFVCPDVPEVSLVLRRL